MARLIYTLDRYQWLILAAAAPFLLFPSPSRCLALLVIPLIFLIGWLARREAIPPTPLNGSLLLMSLMVLVSLWTTVDLVISLEGIARILLGFATFFCFARYSRTPGGWRWAILFFVLTGPAIASIGLLGTQWVTNKFNVLARIVSFFPARWTSLAGSTDGFNPSAVAGALLFVLPFLICCTVVLLKKCIFPSINGESERNPWIVRLLAVSFTLITLYMLVVFILAQSRATYLALAFILVTYLWLAAPRKVRIVLVGLILVGSVSLAVAIHQQGLSAFVEAPLDVSTGNAEEYSLDTLDSRIELWSRALYAIQDFPLTGLGMNVFRQAVHRLYPLFLAPPGADLGHSHNEFLQAALELGIPGLTAFMAVYIGAFSMLVQLSGFAKKGLGALTWGQVSISLQSVILGLGGGLAAYLLSSMVDVHVLVGKVGIVFWILLGLIAGLHAHLAERGRASLTHSAPSAASEGPRS